MLNLNLNASKRGFPRVKTPARLSEPLSQRLNAYALAAGAAGVAVLASTMPAEAEPVCKTLTAQLTRTSTFPLYLIDQAVPPFNIAQGTNSTFRSISVTGIGTIMWWNRGFFTPNTAGAKMLLGPKQWPADVASGSEIGPGGNFGKGASYGLLFTYGKGHFSYVGGGTKVRHEGNLNLTQNNYIGFEFVESGALHFGWARLSVSFKSVSAGNVKHTLVHVLGYGYESTPDTAIGAGSCAPGEQANMGNPKVSSASAGASLGTLALGSAGVAK
jgi:hypothetical protein